MARKPWRKLWQDRLRSSPKWTRLRTIERGFWFDLFLLAKDDGRLELRPGVPLTAKDLAFEFRTKTNVIEKWQRKLIEVGLMEERDGFHRLTMMEQLCLKSDQSGKLSGTAPENEQGETGQGKHLGDNYRTDSEKSLRVEVEREIEVEEKRTPIPPEGDLNDNGHEPEGFVRWYALYPNKVGRTKALAYWTGKIKLITKKTANHEPHAEKIIASLIAQIGGRDAVESRGTFVPEWKHADSYLYNRRWEDPPMKHQGKAEGGVQALGSLRKWEEEFEFEGMRYVCGSRNGRRGLFREDQAASGGWRFKEAL